MTVRVTVVAVASPCSAGFVVFRELNDLDFYVMKIDQCNKRCDQFGCDMAVTMYPFPATACGANLFTSDASMRVNGAKASCDNANCGAEFTLSGNTLTAGKGITIVFYAVFDDDFPDH